MTTISLHQNDTPGPITAQIGSQSGKLKPAVWLDLNFGGCRLILHLDNLAAAKTLADTILAAVTAEGRVSDPNYTPTVAEACRHPTAFADGFAEF